MIKNTRDLEFEIREIDKSDFDESQKGVMEGFIHNENRGRFIFISSMYRPDNVLLGNLDGGNVGFAVYCVSRGEINVYGHTVRESLRGNGYATQMIRKLEDIGRNEGCRSIVLKDEVALVPHPLSSTESSIDPNSDGYLYKGYMPSDLSDLVKEL